MTTRLDKIQARADKLLEQSGPPDDGVSVPSEYDYLVAYICDDDIPTMMGAIRAMAALIADGAPIKSSELYDDMGHCHYCYGEWEMEEDGYARVQHRADCIWALSKKALAPLLVEER